MTVASAWSVRLSFGGEERLFCGGFRGSIELALEACQRPVEQNDVFCWPRFQSVPAILGPVSDYDRRSGRGTTRAEDAQGTPTQSHISPSILVYEDKPGPNFWNPVEPGASSRGGPVLKPCSTLDVTVVNQKLTKQENVQDPVHFAKS